MVTLALELSVALLPVGANVLPQFPTTMRAFHRLSDARINILSIIYNHNFGIIASDDTIARRENFQAFITGR